MDEEYAAQISKLAVARACVALGFKQCEKPALDSLADVLQNYIRTLGMNAQDQAEISGRAHAGIQDVIPVLEFTRPKSTSWKELRNFAFDDLKVPLSSDRSSKWNQPFPFEVPLFPVPNPHISKQSNSKLMQEILPEQREACIPGHLPSFPPLHTYKKSAAGKKRKIAQINTDRDNIRSAPKKSNRTASIKSAQQSLSVIEDSIDISSS